MSPRGPGTILTGIGYGRNPVHRDLLRFMLLAGQRRTETSLVEWDHLSEDLWHLPAEITKTGTDHTVPLGPLSRALLAEQARHAGTGLVFPGRGLRPISGWTKLVTPVREAYGDSRWCSRCTWPPGVPQPKRPGRDQAELTRRVRPPGPWFQTSPWISLIHWL